MNGKIGFVCGLFLMLLLGSGIVMAQDEPVPQGFINIDVGEETEDGIPLEVGVLTIKPLVTAGGESADEELKEAWQDDCSDYAAKGYDSQMDCMINAYEERTTGEEFSDLDPGSLDGAVLKVQYFNPLVGKLTTVPGCGQVVADQIISEYMYYGRPIDYYYGRCIVPKEIYAGTETSIHVSLLTSPIDVRASEQSTKIGEVGKSPAGLFAAGVTDAINVLIEGSEYDTLPCIGVFLIMGLLLASMYFAGKSPITLLDITTPRLPAPKGLSAGGQVMLPHGYGEMKRGIGRKMVASAAFGGTLARGFSGKRGYDRERSKMEEISEKFSKTAAFKKAAIGGGEEAKKMHKTVAAAAREAGMTAKETEHLFNKLAYQYGDAEHKTLSTILDRLKAKGGKEALLANSVRDYMLGIRNLQTMDALSGHPDATTRSRAHQKVQNVAGKLMGSNRYPLVAVIGPGSIDSVVRSTGTAWRGTKEFGMQIPTLTRGVARTTMEMIGGSRVMEKMEKTRPGVAAWLKKPARTVKIGQMFPINEKMEHLYKTLAKEIENDEIKFLLKQLYDKLGVNFAITEEELVQMGFKPKDILKEAGYYANIDEIRKLEERIMPILMDSSRSAAQKRDALIAIAKEYNAISSKALASMTAFNAELADIEASTEPGQNKFLRLQKLLIDHQNGARAAAAGEVMTDDHFYTVVGRNSISGSDLWETMVLRTLVYDAEKGNLHEGAGLKEELQLAWLKTVNRMVSLKPTSNMGELPEYMRNRADLEKLEKMVNKTLGELLTDDGKASLREFTGKTLGTASIKDHLDVLYGGKSKAPGDYDKISKDGKVAVWGDSREMGALEGNYKVNVKELWIGELDTRTPIPIGMWTESRFKRSYIDPYDATVEAILDRRPDSSKWSIADRTIEAKKEWTKKLLSEDMEQRFNSHFALNAYGKMQESAAFYIGISAGFLEKALTEKGLDDNHPDLVFARTLDVSNRNQVEKLNKMLTKYRGEYEGVIKKPVTYDDIVTSKQALVMLYEGGFAFAHKAMPVSGADRVYGVATIRDPNNPTKKHEFAPEDVMIDFKDERLQKAFSDARNTKDPGVWDSVIASAEKWKNDAPSYERERTFAALVWEFGNHTYDYGKWYSKTALEISPRREAMPLAPDFMRMFGYEGKKAGEVLKPWRNLVHDFGGWFGKVSIAAGGPAYKASYDVTAVSEHLRQQSWHIAASYYTKDWSTLTSQERRAFEAVGIAHQEYHMAWQWGIDRNPLRQSTSHGLQQATESFFHFGPRSAFDAEDYLRGTMTGSQWKVFKYGPYGLVADLATKMQRVPANMFGGMQMAMQGYPSRWDLTGNSLKPWDYTPTRLGEAVKALNPFAADWYWSKDGAENKYFQKMSGGLNVWEGSMQRRQLTGPDIMKGLGQAPQDVFYKRVGTFGTARMGEANPSASYYDYQYNLKLDPAMAEWMIRNKDAYYLYDKEVKEQAMSNTMRRTVAVEALAMRRSQELRGFGVFQNSLYGWFCPPMFMWNMPVPGFPPSGSPKELTMGAVRKWRSGGGGRTLGATAKEKMRSSVDTATRVMKPHMAALTGYCRKCGKPLIKGNRCVCGGFSYGT